MAPGAGRATGEKVHNHSPTDVATCIMHCVHTTPACMLYSPVRKRDMLLASFGAPEEVRGCG